MLKGAVRNVCAVWFVVMMLAYVSVAQGCSGYIGSWATVLGTRNFLVLTLTPSAEREQPMTGSLTLPANWQTNEEGTYSKIHGGNQTDAIISTACKDGLLTLVPKNSVDGAEKNKFKLKRKDEGHAVLQIEVEGFTFPPFDVTRVKETARVAEDWIESKTYSPDDDLPSNPEMKRIFDEDQRVRQPGTKVDWTVVGKSDVERRKATSDLLKVGALHTGEDFTWAAFLFQHGDSSNDYLMAHTLALIALKKGYSDALWIATATLDRYLQMIHQPQVYGTQYKTLADKPSTQEPYDRELISDGLRRQLGVPVQAAQDEQRKKYDVERRLMK